MALDDAKQTSKKYEYVQKIFKSQLHETANKETVVNAPDRKAAALNANRDNDERWSNFGKRYVSPQIDKNNSDMSLNKLRMNYYSGVKP